LGSIVVWTLTAFPNNISYSKNYALEIERTKTAYKIEIDAAPEPEKVLLKQKRDLAVAELIKNRKTEKAEKSFMGRIGKVVAPIFAPIGIDWRGSVALLSGFVAKEIVVSTMGILYAADEEDSEALKNALFSSGMTSAAALAMMVFVLLYMPCLATLAAIRRETASLKWMIFSISYSTLLAWGMAFIVYQFGTMIGV